MGRATLSDLNTLGSAILAVFIVTPTADSIVRHIDCNVVPC